MQKQNTPLIETERLVLRRFSESDVNGIYLIFSDEEVNKFLPWYPFKNEDDARQYYYNHILPDYNKDKAYRYAIALKSDNRAIGYVNISDIGQSNDLGYGLRKEFWHKGITTEAVKAVTSYLRSSGMPYITATHDVNNPYSGEVMRKIGMTYRYSYEEMWQPKNFLVTFRMYQLNLDGEDSTYKGYQKKYKSFIESLNCN